MPPSHPFTAAACVHSCTNVTACEWTYTGLGIQYQVLAGPAFIGVFTIAGLVFGSLADSYNR